jgi:sarcosine oxidase subunit alpha
MVGPFRIERGAQIDRTRPVHFTFDGRALTGFAGDTLASALLGAGVRVVGRGMKFHRPRGVLTAGMEEPNALVTIGAGARRETCVRATMQPLYKGLEATSQNCWPSLSFDIGRLNDVLHPLFPAGFYNKTFIWPSWHTFEPAIRRIAGLGVAPEGEDPDRYEWRNAHCDVLVVGGGAAGMLAAYLAGRSGARVILLESDTRLGGGMNWESALGASTRSGSTLKGPTPEASTLQASASAPGAAPHENSAHDAIQQLAATSGLRVLLQTTAVGCYDHGVVAAIEKLGGRVPSAGPNAPAVPNASTASTAPNAPTASSASNASNVPNAPNASDPSNASSPSNGTDSREASSPPNATNPPNPSNIRERWWRIRAKHIVLASGAFEQPLAFPFNDRPGIMLCDSIRHYLNRYSVAAGQCVALATNNDSAYQVALDLRTAGISVPVLLDTRAEPPAELTSAVRSAGVAVHRDARILRTHGSPSISSLEFTATTASRERFTTRIQCDALGMSGGWNPVAHLYCQAGGRLRFDAHDACLVPDGKLENVHAVGAAAGQFDTRTALQETQTTLSKILESLGLPMYAGPPLWQELSGAQPTRRTPQSIGKRTATGPLGYNESALRDRTWLDFQHDVTVSDIDLAVRENLVSVEHVKRYTTVGMSIDQGKTSNLNALAVLADRTQRTIAEVGTTTFRPMFVPVTLGAIAGGRNGRFYKPKRLLPAHVHHEQSGAHFEDYGGWQRPTCYPRAGESHSAAIEREARAVRAGVGLYDASPLGKLLVRGPDAAEFLNRIYANSMDTLPVGRVRYGLMLNEQGIVIDDGVCARLSGEEFWVNTTSAGSSRISAWFEEWLQGEWPQLQVVLTDVTSGWATINVAGPHARDTLARFPSDIDFSREAFPHMHVRIGTFCDVPCRVLRVSFTGELSYEISVPADFGASLWERLYAAGQEFAVTPFGVEAILLMRTEKGYLHIGADTDGTTVPDDIGFGAALSRKASDFVGRRSLTLPENLRKDRLQLVGLRCLDGPDAFTAGAHLLSDPLAKLPQLTSGYLTSAVFSPTLGTHVGLGLLKDGRARLGQTIHVVDAGKQSRAEVVNPAHFDPAGGRLNA